MFFKDKNILSLKLNFFQLIDLVKDVIELA